ncbi:hypothetical protein HKX69_06010 [Streptomyces argyrophyllae]|uniref:Uncharacterized protein n=1 Tax=Streptomyces argyrophylli TaxID=2726118 RepID=A0A6M4PEJ1_9ACTN|nr:hypothetical protein [Streptomyces argyrophyllae]QJS09127.1 hypothetical protein HKX69_06010 [Streptomyces argyrophyllae]
MTRKERQAHYAEQRQRQAEREAARARFKADPKGITAEMRRRALEADHQHAMRQKVAGLRPLGAPKRLGPVSGLANLMVAGVDQANAGDVFGHNERERAELPNKPLTPGAYSTPKKESAPKKKKRKGAPKMRQVHGNHFVTELPDRLKKYASA